VITNENDKKFDPSPKDAQKGGQGAVGKAEETAELNHPGGREKS
jgi:hypothetical protein